MEWQTMATVRTKSAVPEIEYPTSDGRPMAETDIHREDMVDLIEVLKDWYTPNLDVYVSGNMLMYYVPGDKRRHVSPDVFVVHGIPKRPRDYYLVWEEGKSPDVVIELTSSSTRAEDTKKKFKLYQDVLKVSEYFLFDPKGDYLHPSLQGHRLTRGRYVPIRPVRDRLPSRVLELHLERSGEQLRLYDPIAEEWLKTPRERAEAAEAKLTQEQLARLEAEAEVARLRRKLQRLGGAES
jgi:Uma2 family endonuclease